MNSALSFFSKVQAKCPLKEGISGHWTILRTIYRHGCISMAELAYESLIPLPVLVSVINFHINHELLSRIPEGVLFTEKGMQFAEKDLAFFGFGVQACETCGNHPELITPRWEPVLDELTQLIREFRPSVDTTLDQAFATPETSLLRALYLYDNGALEGKSVIFLGDDDFTSVAIALLFRGFFPEDAKLIPLKITVVDIDSRILSGIRSCFKKLGLTVETVEWDYRKPVPEDLRNGYDTVCVDPPYSFQAVKLIFSRAASILRALEGSELYLSFAHRPPLDFIQIQITIIEHNFCLQEIIPRFNFYEGASVLGNSTQMIRCIAASVPKFLIPPTEEFAEKLYTGELNPHIRVYLCRNCHHQILIGNNQPIRTVELLKEMNCPHCGGSGPFDLDETISASENTPFS